MKVEVTHLQKITLTAAQEARLIRLGSATIYEAAGQTGAVDSALRPIDPQMTVVGTAFTVDVEPGDNLMVHLGVVAASPGDVLVVNANGCLDAGPWGDVLTIAAQAAGIRGLVIDGAVRDSSAIIDAGFSTFARGLCIRGTTKTRDGSVGGDIDLAGTRIATGDIIVGDRDGLVVIPKDDYESILARAESRFETELAYREQLLSGATTIDLLGLEPTLKALGHELTAPSRDESSS